MSFVPVGPHPVADPATYVVVDMELNKSYVLHFKEYKHAASFAELFKKSRPYIYPRFRILSTRTIESTTPGHGTRGDHFHCFQGATTPMKAIGLVAHKCEGKARAHPNCEGKFWAPERRSPNLEIEDGQYLCMGWCNTCVNRKPANNITRANPLLKLCRGRAIVI
tara:strand:+ start:10365 stop:10859 length:495 start_codon:yes stop_codon:yes gene_type:complete